VVAAAVLVCDRDGLAGLTVAAVAGEVGCRPPSVYHHVDGLAGLSRAVALVATRDLVATLQDAVADRTGLDACTALAAATRAWAAAHPHRVEALRYHDDVEDPELETARAGALLLFQDTIAGLGIAPADRPALVAMLLAALRGAIDAANDSKHHDTEGLDAARATGHDLLVDLALEHLAAVAAGAPASPRRSDDPSRPTP
jgi:AcrR family transcriptional regulator